MAHLNITFLVSFEIRLYTLLGLLRYKYHRNAHKLNIHLSTRGSYLRYIVVDIIIQEYGKTYNMSCSSEL